MINYGQQFIDNQDIKSVTKVLKSKLITQGPNLKKFELALAKRFSSKYCSVVSNGTAALHLLAVALGWKKNDIILTTPVSFLATSNSILYSGATPKFIDIDPLTNNINTTLLKKEIYLLKKKKKKVTAIIAVDFAGHPCDWLELKKISKKFKITLINDNCHAFGASIKKNKSYAIKYADFVTLSFHAVKHITTGEGGAIISNNKNIIKKINLLRNHGVIRSKKFKPWEYKMIYLGFNYRLTDFQSALGLSQLSKINKFLKRRKQIAKLYDYAFKNIKNIEIPNIKKDYEHAYHLYPLKIDFEKFNIKKENFFKKLKKNKINLQVHYIPIHLQPFYKKKFKTKKGDFPNAEIFYKKEVSLPIYYGLTNKKIMFVVKNIKKILRI